MNCAENLIALQDQELNNQAVGRIVFWQLVGPVSQEALSSALSCEGAPAPAPEAVTPAVALHRAVETVARTTTGDVHALSRGVWAIVGKPQVQDTGTELGSLAYAVRSKVRLGLQGPAVEGAHAQEIAATYTEARASLSPQDVSAWLCKQLDKLGAVALRETGGFYFVPQDVAPVWERVASAVKFASAHKLYAVPALRSADALDAILNAVTADTHAACAEASRDLGTAGKRALATKEQALSDLVTRAGRYEKILGKKLDGLRAAIDQTRASVATALFALSSEETET